jgi:hypothetical protein
MACSIIVTFVVDLDLRFVAGKLRGGVLASRQGDW